jgi:hypothetical protein
MTGTNTGWTCATADFTPRSKLLKDFAGDISFSRASICMNKHQLLFGCIEHFSEYTELGITNNFPHHIMYSPFFSLCYCFLIFFVVIVFYSFFSLIQKTSEVFFLYFEEFDSRSTPEFFFLFRRISDSQFTWIHDFKE